MKSNKWFILALSSIVLMGAIEAGDTVFGGFLQFSGGYDDLRFPASQVKLLGNSDPDWAQFSTNGAGSNGVYVLAFDKLTPQEVAFVAQLPHGTNVGAGETLCPHVHWAPNDGDSGNVVWCLEYQIVDINGTYANTTISCATIAADETAKKHQFDELPDIALTSISGVSAILIGRLYRDAGDAADTFDDDANLFEFDFHYKFNTFGSKTETSKFGS